MDTIIRHTIITVLTTGITIGTTTTTIITTIIILIIHIVRLTRRSRRSRITTIAIMAHAATIRTATLDAPHIMKVAVQVAQHLIVRPTMVTYMATTEWEDLVARQL